MTPLETIFKVNAISARTSIKTLKKIYGLKTNIYFPQKVDNIYQDGSEEYDYGATPDITDTFLIVGIFNESTPTPPESISFSNFDFEEPKCFETNLDYLNMPRNSKWEVYLGEAFYTFRNTDVKVVNGLDNKPLYGIITLVPYL